MNREALALLIAVTVLPAGPARAQLRAYQPLSGQEYQQLIGDLLAIPKEKSRVARASVTLRILAPVRPERQLWIGVNSDGSGGVLVTELSRPLQAVANELLAQGATRPIDPRELRKIVHVERYAARVEARLAQQELEKFGRLLEKLASAGIAAVSTLAKDAGGEIPILLDATVYSMRLEGEPLTMSVELSGPHHDAFDGTTAEGKFVAATVEAMRRFRTVARLQAR